MLSAMTRPRRGRCRARRRWRGRTGWTGKESSTSTRRISGWSRRLIVGGAAGRSARRGRRRPATAMTPMPSVARRPNRMRRDHVAALAVGAQQEVAGSARRRSGRGAGACCWSRDRTARSRVRGSRRRRSAKRKSAASAAGGSRRMRRQMAFLRRSAAMARWSASLCSGRAASVIRGAIRGSR